MAVPPTRGRDWDANGRGLKARTLRKKPGGKGSRSVPGAGLLIPQELFKEQESAYT